LENIRKEYREVGLRLADIAAFEAMPEEEKKLLGESVSKIKTLDETRNELLGFEKKITDDQFSRMQEEESSIPNSVRQLKSNEAYLDAIKRDLHFLEGEKVEWTILRQECEHEQVVLRRLAVFLLALFSIAVFTLVAIRLYMDYDIQLMLLVAAFITTLIGVYILIKYQDCTKEIKQCDVNKNQAILLENRVKAKYVNIKNAVDYACDKYHVKNSYELTYLYEQFQTTVREQERFKQTNDDLAYYNNRLTAQMEGLHLHDTSYWIHNTSVVIHEKELKSLKADLIGRRQTLNKSIEDTLAAIEEMKEQVNESTHYMGEVSKQVKQIMDKLDEINKTS
jgi:methyl-accepting chemotaxis protein